MYNRYIPQSDGSFRKNRVPDPEPSRDRQPEPTHQEHRTPPCPPPTEECHTEPQTEAKTSPPPCRQDAPAGDFLRRLLPRDLDTGDLLIILLLLLMAGDCREDRNTALLTLALYLFM